MEKFELVKRVVATYGKVEGAEAFLLKKTLQIGLVEKDLIQMKGKASVILDFGQELVGGARVLTYKVGGSKSVRLRFGESVSETCAELGERGACNDHSNRDMTVDLQSYSDMTFGQTGFRFLRIDTLDENTEIWIKTVVAATSVSDREELGAFECNDETINQIWKTAAHTIRLCMQNGYLWDGVKRDRLVWIGDLYPETRAAECLFGSIPEVENSLRFAANERPATSWMSGFPAYSLWWLLILAREYNYRGSAEGLQEFLPFAEEMLEHIATFVRADGTVDYTNNFIDWPSWDSREPADEAERVEGVTYLTKKAFEEVLQLPIREEVKTLCKEKLSVLATHTATVKKYKQIAGIGVWSGDKSKTNEEILLAGGAKGLSTFMSYFILTGVAAYGKYEEALAIAKEYYGGMLSVGATSFWEDFDIEWLEGAGRIDQLPKDGEKDIHGDYGKFCYKGFRHSFCHGWSAGIIPYLIETVLGVTPVKLGYLEVRIKPNLSGLTYAKGSVPTPYGVITVSHELQSDGTVKTEYDAPKEIKVVL